MVIQLFTSDFNIVMTVWYVAWASIWAMYTVIEHALKIKFD
ncbi:hypothetical protein C4K01_2737 [Pseudomonas synxantha]|nr:hypothetical protein C4K01_2737 [Pseudomonas synxantha]